MGRVIFVQQSRNPCQKWSSLLLLSQVFWFILWVFVTPVNAQPATQVENRPTITWGVNSAPPFHILDGNYQGSGVCDALIDTVHRHLPHYRKKIIVMPQPRISQALLEKQQLCFPCMIHPMQPSERARFSLPTHSYRPHRLIMTSQVAKRILERYPLPIPLTKLLQDRDFRFGYPKGRKFGQLQPLLDLFADSHPPFTRSGDQGVAAILEMIVAGRLDFTLDYPMVTRYSELLHPGQQWTLLPIAENVEHSVFGSIGCGDNTWSAAVIAEINQHIDLIRTDAEFLHKLHFWQQSKDPAYLQLNQQQLRQADQLLRGAFSHR